MLSDGDELEPQDIPQPSNFQPRHLVSNLFSQFTEGFTKNARERGVRLGWVGIGIWNTPNGIVPEKQLEAWKLSRENLVRSSPVALEALHREAQIQQILRLVQNVPLERFRQNVGKEHNYIIRELLNAYREQLIDAIELLVKINVPEPPIVRAAIKDIEAVLGIKHWVGAASAKLTNGKPRPAPGVDAPDENDLYQELFAAAGRDAGRVERLIAHERRFAPQADRKELIRRAIERILRDRQ